MARPTKLTPKLRKKAREYLKTCEDTTEVIGDEKQVTRVKVNLPSIAGLALHLEITRETLYDWRDKDKEFSDILAKILFEQEKRLIEKGLSGDYNPTIAKLVLGKHGYHEKTETDVTSNGKTITGFNYVKPDSDNPSNPKAA